MLHSFLQWLYDQAVSTSVRESDAIFPALECIHIYSMIFLITAIAAFDLRLLGFQFGRHPITFPKFSKLVFRSAGACFAVNVITGGFLFAAKAPDYYANAAFRVKMLLILAGVAYHLLLLSRASRWEVVPMKTFAIRFVGAISLLLWIGVIAASRWIAFA